MAPVRQSFGVASVSLLETPLEKRTYPCGTVTSDGLVFRYANTFTVGQQSPVQTHVCAGIDFVGSVPTAFTWNSQIPEGLYDIRRGSTRDKPETRGEIMIRQAAFLKHMAKEAELRLLIWTGRRNKDGEREMAEVRVDPTMFELLLKGWRNFNVDAISEVFRGITLSHDQGVDLGIEPGEQVALWAKPERVGRDPQSMFSAEVLERILAECQRSPFEDSGPVTLP